MPRLICTFVVCKQKSQVSRNMVHTQCGKANPDETTQSSHVQMSNCLELSCKYIRTVFETLFQTFFSYLKANNFTSYTDGINLAINETFFQTFFFLSQSKQLLWCSLVYNTQPPSGTISLTLDMHLHLHSFYVYVSNYAPGKTVRVCRLV